MGILNKLGIKKDSETSKDVAKERLQFILVQDRIKLSPSDLENLQEEILEILNKYVEVDRDNIKVNLEREEEMMALVANFPINNRSDSEESY